MSTIQTINVNRIDPDSTINVRRQGGKENVQKVKESIQQHGYWPDQPIIVCPHPDPKSEYDYQNVTGQCRLKAKLLYLVESAGAVNSGKCDALKTEGLSLEMIRVEMFRIVLSRSGLFF